MAINELQSPGDVIKVTKASVSAGDPVVVGAITGVAEVGSYTDADGTANQVEVNTSGKAWNLSVKGVITGPANSAVAFGDQLYITDGHTPKIDKDTGGIPFGIALGTVGSGSTATIKVKHLTL